MGARNEVPDDCLPPISGSLVDFAKVVSLSEADAIRTRTNSEDILDSFMISKEVLELRKNEERSFGRAVHINRFVFGRRWAV